MGLLRRVPAQDGFKVSSRRGWLFFSLGGDIFLMHLSVGRFSVALERSHGAQKSRIGKRK